MSCTESSQVPAQILKFSLSQSVVRYCPSNGEEEGDRFWHFARVPACSGGSPTSRLPARLTGPRTVLSDTRVDPLLLCRLDSATADTNPAQNWSEGILQKLTPRWLQKDASKPDPARSEQLLDANYVLTDEGGMDSDGQQMRIPRWERRQITYCSR